MTDTSTLVTNAVPFIRPTGDNPQYERGALFALVEVDSLTSGLSIGSTGVLHPFGVSQCEILSKDIPLYESMVRTEIDVAEMAQAAKVYELKFAQHISAGLSRLKEAGCTPLELEQEEHKIRAHYTKSPEAEYFSTYFKSPKPLRAFRVLDQNRPNTSDKARVHEESAVAGPLAAAVSTAVAAAMATALPAVMKEIVAALAQQGQGKK